MEVARSRKEPEKLAGQTAIQTLLGILLGLDFIMSF
jgi:hypothetical protein